MAEFFICYRREDSGAEAGRLYDFLSQHLGGDAVFMDVGTLRPGTDYRVNTERHLQECRALLAIIGRKWQEIRDVTGRRRLELADDLVRFEIEFALSRGITVIPVLVDGATAPSESSLPDSLKPLSRRHAIRVDTPEFRRDSEKLLEVLRRLNHAGRSPRWTNWRVAAMLVTTVLLFTTLALTEVRQAAVEIQLRVSQFGFRVATTQPVVNGISVDRLGVAGLSGITLPRQGQVAHAALLIEVASPGRISLPPLVLPAGSWVWYQRGAVANEVQIALKASSLEFHASVEGTVRIGPPDSKPYVLTFDVPERVEYKAESDGVELSVMAPMHPIELSRQVKVDSLSFTAVDQAAVLGDTIVRAISAIEGGTVIFWPGRGPAREVKSGDSLQFALLEGQLRTVEFENDTFTLQFAGTVQGMRIGVAGATAGAMPSYLEAAWVNYRLHFLAAAVIYFVVGGLIVTRRRAAPS